VHDDERVHPAPVRGRDEQVAARRNVLLARGPDPEAQKPEQHEPGKEANRAIAERGPRFRLAPQPGEAFADTAARVSQGLRGEPSGRRPSTTW
jgi:hypothetical protein